MLRKVRAMETMRKSRVVKVVRATNQAYQTLSIMITIITSNKLSSNKYNLK